ncbi:MAG: aspartate-semialdehyde dehydrogenase [Saprospiraceae bacterium]|nr:aspartate-semialdehyde dehydrogenase [Saprospiraceae bacterium]
MKLAIVGVTGLVGSELLNVLEELNFSFDELIPVATERSIGKIIHYKAKEYKVVSMEDAITQKPHIAIFSAGGDTSLFWAPKFEEVGTFVIDNSSAWRMNERCPLVVPEINQHTVTNNTKIIANPNCSTIQMVLALNPLHIEYGIDRIVVSTYQSFTGTGMKAVRQYESEKNRLPVEEPRAYKHPIFENCIPQCDSFLPNDYTKEEMKLVNETKKILNDSTIRVTATAVRVPVFGGHSESVNVSFKKPISLNRIKEILACADGILVMDNPESSVYPTPLQAHRKNEVLVGRIRLDESQENTINLWITADNLRKGAATNAVQIAQSVVNQFFK